jgi:cation diffusion facilitator CzcD-associated flavoprotein CzcO
MGSMEQPDYDVLVIGAGLSGCYACYRMRQIGAKLKVLETGSSVGGTWFWSKSACNIRMKSKVPFLTIIR